MKSTWYTFLPLILVAVLATALGALEMNKDPEYFSSESLAVLHALNARHQMVVDDLTTNQESALVSELLQANAFLDSTPNPSVQGLIVSTESASGNGLLLLQPLEALSEVELKTIAKEYEAAIPEFIEVELDQDLELLSPLYEWEFFGKSFEPSEERDAIPVESPVTLTEELIQIAVIDSGVDIGHEVFKDVKILKGWNTLSDSDDMFDDVGHGTHVAGIIATNAPGIEIIPYKIVDANGGKLSNVLEAMSKALEDQVEIMNTSFGLASPSYSLETMVEKAHEEGVIIVSAAGNNAKDSGFYPAQYEHTIAVASVDSNDQKLPKSNYGEWVDVAAYGYHVRSALPDGAYGYKTGTSQAAPVVAAAVARLMMSSTSGELTFEGIVSALKNSSLSKVLEGELEGLAIVQ